MANALSVAGSNSKYKEPGAKPAGFWGGLWHGMIAPLAFLISLFEEGVSIYETNNNGRWYEFGFMDETDESSVDYRLSEALSGGYDGPRWVGQRPTPPAM